MKKLLQPFKVGEDVGLFLVNFERTCEKLSFAPETWPQRLLTLLPCEAAEVVARLSAGDADDYDKVKSSLLKRYRLSAEAFRQRFRNASKKSSEGYSEFAYGLKTNLIEWLKSEEVYESRDKVVEFKLWVQDRVGVDSVERAAELAEEYATRRKLSGEESESGRSDQPGQKVPDKSAEHLNGDEARKSPTGQFEARKPFLCYNCQEPGHTEARCKKPRVVFSYVNGSDEDLKLLRPYLHELQVNGKPMLPSTFDRLLTLVESSIQRQDTNWRECIPAKTRLEITLSKILLAMCDSGYKFLYVDVGRCGGESDGGVFRRCQLSGALESNQLWVPEPVALPGGNVTPYVILGDEAFPQKPYLMRPYPKRSIKTDADKIFNYRLSRARRVIENAFGILTSRWRILRRRFKANDENVNRYVLASIALHNFLVTQSEDRNKYCPPKFVDSESWNGDILNGEWRKESGTEAIFSQASQLGSNKPCNVAEHFAQASEIILWGLERWTGN
ncbi:hypothetical protein HPB47_026203 [Ixodes persulcatus]|uniref:Uncharacterized protein n=1 Tax=Ixodes persulcatus TaxID=34615 RepID=A0AC60Q0Z9_IXOPE|nr:hypothetical protein HPB47_026203 [Ixodes persulcatus]